MGESVKATAAKPSVVAKPKGMANQARPICVVSYVPGIRGPSAHHLVFTHEQQSLADSQWLPRSSAKFTRRLIETYLFASMLGQEILFHYQSRVG